MKWWRNLRQRSEAISPPAVLPATPTTAVLEELDHLLASGALDEARSRLASLGLETAGDIAGEPPVHPDLRLRFIRLLRRQGRAEEASALCESLLAEECDATAVHLELADCALAQHDLARALEHAEVSASINGDSAISWLRVGQILMRLDRLAEAEPALARATSGGLTDPQALSDAWYALGEARRVLKLPEAPQAYQNCIAIRPSHVDAHVGLAHSYMMSEDEERALHWYSRAIELGASVPVGVRLNIGSIHQNAGRYDAARQQFEAVLAERPSDHVARFYLCMLDLLTEQWIEGWKNFPARFAAGAAPYRPMPYTPWDGRTLARDEPLLVLADEGLGDEIMYASCLPDLAKRASYCIVECEPRLLPLFRRSFPELHVVATQRENSTQWLAGLPTPKWQVCAGDLPALFRRSSEDFPPHDGYLRADPQKVAAWRQRLRRLSSGRPVIGISWRGGTAGTRTKARSISVEEWRPILQVPGITFVNLQYGAYQVDLAALQDRLGITVHDFPEIQPDYDETAALVAAMDGVVSVCTAIVHLAGALGQRTWVLTPLAPGWRYTAHERRMPWYPSVEIVRQDIAGDWQAPCQKVSTALSAF